MTVTVCDHWTYLPGGVESHPHLGAVPAAVAAELNVVIYEYRAM